MMIKQLVVQKAGPGNGSHPGDLLITVPVGEQIFAYQITKRSMFISTDSFKRFRKERVQCASSKPSKKRRVKLKGTLPRAR